MNKESRPSFPPDRVDFNGSPFSKELILLVLYLICVLVFVYDHDFAAPALLGSIAIGFFKERILKLIWPPSQSNLVKELKALAPFTDTTILKMVSMIKTMVGIDDTPENDNNPLIRHLAIESIHKADQECISVFDAAVKVWLSY